MRIEYQELMDRLGVGQELSPYETRPWFYYDEEEGISCSAEVRVGPGLDDVEAEIQFLYDEPDDDDEDDDGDDDGSSFMAPEQVMLMRFMPMGDDQLWMETRMIVQGEDYNNKIHDWGARGCEFFCLCIGALQMGELPDIEDLIDTELTDDDFFGRGGRRGRVGKKGLKVAQKPPGMKSM